MRRRFRVAGLALAAGAIIFAACASGPRKVVVNEGVCGNVRFLRLNLGEVNRLVLDNTRHSDNQFGMSLVLQDFPVVVKGPIPENSVIGPRFSTINLRAGAGEKASVDLQPTFAGEYIAKCQISILKAASSGQQLIEQSISFDLK